MKKISTLAVILFTTLSMYCQTPELMSYQAVVRDADSELLTDQAVGMKISILEDTASGTPVYVETQNPSTNSNGLLSLQVGAGTNVSGDITTIDWANHDYFIRTETDPTGGGSYTITGTSQILSVPYALLSKNVINDLVDDADNDPSNEYNTGFTFNGTDLEITDGGSIQTVDLSVLDNTNLQAELDTTQTGAGLATDGTYTANTSTNYIAGATALNDADDKLDAQAKVTADAISANNTQISGNTTAIATNATDIATNVTDIAANVTAISTNASGIATNGTAISTNASGIATNVTAISTNASGIASNGTAISTNATDIATNVTDIATNATDIAGNTTVITTNATAISTNATDIATNVTDIATNATDIAGNTTVITTNATAISTNATDIATNVTDIATNATDIATNVTAITLNTAKDTNVSTDLTITGTTGARVIISSDGTDATIPVATAVVSGVMSKATYDEHLVNTAKTGITTDQATAISTNATDIATNVTDIATNATDIATNVTAIALNTAKTGITPAQTNAIAINTAKVTNATHTGDVTGATALTIANAAVTSSKIANDAVTSSKIASQVVTNEKIVTVSASKLTGAVGIANGGTNLTTYTQGDILYATSPTTLVKLSKGTAGQVLAMNTGATAPEWVDSSGGSGTTYALNTFYAELGGYVIQISPNGKHGLVVAMQDQGSSNWYQANDLLSNPSNHDADGKEFSDWRIPTKRELNLMYSVYSNGNGANLNDNCYWSSTEYDFDNGWAQFFYNGYQYNINKNNTYYVRAVRAF